MSIASPSFFRIKYEPEATTPLESSDSPPAWIGSTRKPSKKLAAHDQDLIRTFIDGISDIEGPDVLRPPRAFATAPAFSPYESDGLDPHELSAILESQFGILTRPGIHCAPLAHQTIAQPRLVERRDLVLAHF